MPVTVLLVGEKLQASPLFFEAQAATASAGGVTPAVLSDKKTSRARVGFGSADAPRRSHSASICLTASVIASST